MMETNFVTTSYPVMIGIFYRYKVLPVTIETILCVRYFAQAIEMFFKCPIFVKFGFKLLIFAKK